MVWSGVIEGLMQESSYQPISLQTLSCCCYCDAVVVLVIVIIGVVAFDPGVVAYVNSTLFGFLSELQM